MSGARVLVKKVKMRVPAGNATAAPPVGPTLGQAGVNLMDFCKLFNARTQKYKEGIKLPVKLLTYSDRSFEFHVSTPPATYFLKKAAGIEKGTPTPGKATVGQITLKQIYGIAQIKQNDPTLKRLSLESVCKMLIGTARSVGLEVVWDVGRKTPDDPIP